MVEEYGVSRLLDELAGELPGGQVPSVGGSAGVHSEAGLERAATVVNPKLRRSTDKRRVIVEFFPFLAAALTVIRRLINTARTRYRGETRPTTRRLR